MPERIMNGSPRVGHAPGLLLLPALFLALLIVLGVLSARTARMNAMDSVRMMARNQAQLQAEHASSLLRTVDVALGAVVSSDRLPEAILAGDRSAVKAHVQHFVRFLPQVANVLVQDAAGKVILDLYPGGPEPSDLELGLVMDRHDQGWRAFWSGQVGAADGSPYVGMSRQVSAADGRLVGAVLVMIEPGYFYERYRDMDTRVVDVIALYDERGGLLSAWTGDGRSLQDATMVWDLPLLGGLRRQALLRSGLNTLESETAVGGVALCSDFPYRIAVAYDVDRMLGGWRDTVHTQLLLLLLVALATGAATWILRSVGQSRRRAELTAMKLAEQQRMRNMLRRVAEASAGNDLAGAVTVCLEEVATFMNWPCGYAWFFSGDRSLRPLAWCLADHPRREALLGAVGDCRPSPEALDLERAHWFQDLRQALLSGVGPVIGAGMRSACVVPVRRENRTIILLCFPAPRGETPDQVALDVVAQPAATLAEVARRREAERGLRASERLYRSMFHSHPAVMILADPETGAIVDANASASRFYGYPREELLGMDVQILTEDPGEDLEARLGSMFVRAGTDRAERMEARHRLHDGSVREVEILGCGVTIRGAGRLFLVVVDVSERVEAERQLMRARDAAQAANHAKSDFLASMSHEIRTPLSGVMGMLQLIRMAPLEPAVAENVDTAMASGRALMTIINDVLDLSRIEAGRLDIRTEPFEPRAVFEEVLNSFRPQLLGRDIRLRQTISPDLPAGLVGDPVRLRQILFNLVGNALKFTPQGAIHVEAWPERGGGGTLLLHCRVSDTGIGIPLNKQEKIFEPFQQAGDSAARMGGSGLGLAIVRRLVDMLGGSIALQSAPDEGTVVTFSIAVRPQDKIARPAGPQAETPQETLRILVAEDNRINRMALTQYLGHLGHTVTEADDGRQAVQRLAENACDVVLMDIQMPVLDGIGAAKAIRAGESGADRRDVPIIALTAHAMAGDRNRLLAEGMDGYLPKPYDFVELETTLRRIVQSRRKGGK